VGEDLEYRFSPVNHIPSRRSRAEITLEVEKYCKKPRKLSHIRRYCNLSGRLFGWLVEEGVIMFHHKEPTVGRDGSHYYIAVDEGVLRG